MRDCVKDAFQNSCSRGPMFRKMRHAIIAELKTLGHTVTQIKDMLLEWNDRCERPLGIGDQRRQLLKYVDWFFDNDGKTGCNALRDYCLGQDKCEFYRRVTRKNRDKTKETPFDMYELDKYLTAEYKAQAYEMMLIVKTLRRIQMEKATGETILIGVRSIVSVIRDTHGHMLSRMDVFRRIEQLIDEEVIEKCVKGKSGTYQSLANGYRFLPWKAPAQEP